MARIIDYILGDRVSTQGRLIGDGTGEEGMDGGDAQQTGKNRSIVAQNATTLPSAEGHFAMEEPPRADDTYIMYISRNLNKQTPSITRSISCCFLKQ